MGGKGIKQNLALDTLDGEEGISKKDLKILDDTLKNIKNSEEKSKFYTKIVEGFKSEDVTIEDKKNIKKIFEKYFENHKDSNTLTIATYKILVTLIPEEKIKEPTEEEIEKVEKSRKQETQKQKLEKQNNKINNISNKLNLKPEIIGDFLSKIGIETGIVLLENTLISINKIKDNKIKNNLINEISLIIEKNNFDDKNIYKNFSNFAQIINSITLKKIIENDKKLKEKDKKERDEEKIISDEIKKLEKNEKYNKKISEIASNFGLSIEEFKNFLKIFNNKENILFSLNNFLNIINNFEENKNSKGLKEKTLNNLKLLIQNHGLTKGNKKNYFNFTHSAGTILSDIISINKNRGVEKFITEEKLKNQELFKLGKYFGLSEEKTKEYSDKLKEANLNLGDFLTDYKNFVENKLSGLSKMKAGRQFLNEVKNFIGDKLGGISDGIDEIKSENREGKTISQFPWDINDKIKENFDFIDNELFPSLQILIKQNEGKLIINKRDESLYSATERIEKTKEMLLTLNRHNSFEKYKGQLFDITKEKVSVFDIKDYGESGSGNFLKTEIKKDDIFQGADFLTEEQKQIEAKAMIAILKKLPELLLPYYGDAIGIKPDYSDLTGDLDGMVENLKASGDIPKEYNRLNSKFDIAIALPSLIFAFIALVPVVGIAGKGAGTTIDFMRIYKYSKRLKQSGFSEKDITKILSNAKKKGINVSETLEVKNIDILLKPFNKKFNKTLNTEQLREINNIKELVKTADGLKGYNWSKLDDLGFTKKEIVFIINSGFLGDPKTIKAIKNMIHSKNKIGSELEKLFESGITDIKQLENVFKDFKLNKIYNRENGMSYSDFDKLSIEEKILSLSTPKADGLSDGLQFSNGGDCNNWSLLFNDILTKANVKHSIVSLPGSEHSFIKGEINGKHFIIDLITDQKILDESGLDIPLNGYREVSIGDDIFGVGGPGEIISFNPLKIQNFAGGEKSSISTYESFNNKESFINRTEIITYDSLTNSYKGKTIEFTDSTLIILIGKPGKASKKKISIDYSNKKEEIYEYIKMKGENNIIKEDILKIILGDKGDVLENSDFKELIKRIDKEAFLKILKGEDISKKELNLIRNFKMSDTERIKEANKLLVGKDIQKGSEEETLILKAHNIGEEKTREKGMKFSELYAEKLELEKRGQKLSPEKEHRLKYIRGKKIKCLTDSGKFTKDEAIKLADNGIIGKIKEIDVNLVGKNEIKKYIPKLLTEYEEYILQFKNNDKININGYKMTFYEIEGKKMFIDTSGKSYMLEKNDLGKIVMKDPYSSYEFNLIVLKKYSEKEAIIDLKNISILKEIENLTSKLGVNLDKYFINNGFNPEVEINNILTSSNRKIKLVEYKKKNNKQLKLFSTMIDDTLLELKNNPNIALEEIISKVLKNSENFSVKQKVDIIEKINEAYVKIKKIDDLILEYKGKDTELLEKVYGVKIDGNIEVERIGVGIIFSIKNKNDFLKLSDGKEYGGFKSPYSEIKELEGSICIIDKNHEYYDVIKIHEAKHALNDIIFRNEKPLTRGKDEIIAFLTDKDENSKTISETLLDQFSGYNYFDKSSDTYLKDWNNYKKIINKSINIAFKIKERYPDTYSEILSVTDIKSWHHLLIDGLKNNSILYSFKNLEKILINNKQFIVKINAKSKERLFTDEDGISYKVINNELCEVDGDWISEGGVNIETIKKI